MSVMEKHNERTVSIIPSWASLVEYLVLIIKENDIGSPQYEEALSHLHQMGRVADVAVEAEKEKERENNERIL